MAEIFIPPEQVDIFILDDEAVTVKRIVYALKRDGYRVEGFVSGREALDRIKVQVPDVIVMDIRLGDADGIELMERMRGIAPELSVILMTGYASIEHAVTATKKGAFHYLEKPIHLNDLRRLIQEALLEARQKQQKWIAVFLAVVAVLFALVGNIIKAPLPGEHANFTIFAEYFIPAMLFVGIMLNRIALLEILLKFIEYLFAPILRLVSRTNENLLFTIDSIQSQAFVFFTRGDNIANLNKVLLYIQGNEHTKKIKIVTVSPERDADLVCRLKKDIEFLDREYPDIKIEFVELEGTFAPELIQNLSKKWNVLVNFMFIGSPGDHFPFRIEELGGVRLII